MSGQAKCWLCQGEAPVLATLVERPPGTKHRPVPPPDRFQYGLSSLLLIMTLVAILCSIISMHRGLGIAVAMLTVPALVWTCCIASERGVSGKPMSAGAKTGVFLRNLALIVSVIVVVIVAAVVALSLICTMMLQGIK